MKALAVFPSSREVRLIDTPEPVIAGATDIKLRILEAGVCGTDREITSFQYGTPPADSPHLVIGHEALGEVVGVGSGVTGLTPGDLAVLLVRRPCPHDGCAPCRRGRPDFCITGDFTERGIKGAHGYMTILYSTTRSSAAPSMRAAPLLRRGCRTWHRSSSDFLPP